MAEVQTRHIVVWGQVQGVGFRNFATLCANNLGLKGWTRNLSAGGVEILIQGQVDHLELFIEQIRRGPKHATVTKLELLEVRKAQIFTNFSRRADGEKKDEF